MGKEAESAQVATKRPTGARGAKKSAGEANVYGRYEKGDARVKSRQEWTIVEGMRNALVARTVYQEVQSQLSGQVR